MYSWPTFCTKFCPHTVKNGMYDKPILGCIHSNSPNPGALGPGAARNSEMSVSGNNQSSTSLYIVSYRHKFLLYMYMYTTIKNTSSVTILWKIFCNFSFFKQGKAGQWSADLAVIAASWGTGT